MQLNNIDRIVGLINRAQTSLEGESENIGEPAVQSALIAAAKRGVDVELIIPGCDEGANNNAPAVKALIAGGVHVKEMPGPSTVQDPYMHAKWWIRDNDQEGFLGSENFTINSLHNSREIGLVFYDQSTMQKMVSNFATDWNAAVDGSTPPACSPGDETTAENATQDSTTHKPRK